MRIVHACLALALPLAAGCQPASPPPQPGEPAAAPASPETPQGDTPAAPLPDSTTANFRCGDLLANARFDNARAELTLTIATRRTVLPQAMAASGARYADAKGNEFWNKGDSATLKLDGQVLDCHVTDQVSPWDEARGRGVAFRGLGTEPFWSLEVDAGPAPPMRLALEMGERQLVVAQAAPLDAGEGFHGTADDGSAVELRISRVDCSDGMSDMVYPASIALTVGTETFKGCGAFLDE